MPPHRTALREDRLTPPRESDSDPHRTALWTWTRLRPSPSWAPAHRGGPTPRRHPHTRLRRAR